MRPWQWGMVLGTCLVACEAPQSPQGQGDPGNQGNGVEEQPEPYLVPPEASRLLDDAPAGSLSPPAVYESSVYPGWRFRYWLYVPTQYVSDTPAALMVFQDGGTNYIDVLQTPTVLDNLIHAGDIPVAIGLFINPGTPSGIFSWDEAEHREARSEQYDAIDDRYARFLLDEIIPDVVLAHYNVVEDPDGWAAVGYSSGGIAAFTAGWHHPERFHKILTHNGSFVDLRGGGAYPALIRATEPKPLRVYLLSGTDDLVLPAGNWFEANNAMAAALDAQGYAFRYRPGSGTHAPDQAMDDFPDALRWLWRGYTLPR